MDESKEDLVPNTNVAAHSFIYQIEVALRELIIETLSNLRGHAWWKQSLPGGIILTKYREAKVYERNTSWVHHIPHHPAYYLDFPELTQIVERNDNWENGFKPIFGIRKDIIIGSLRRLEPIRNKVAHNRKVSEGDVQTASATYTELSTAIGSNRMIALIQRCTSADDLVSRLSSLREEARVAHDATKNYEALGSLPVWTSIAKQWWFDTDYLEADVDPIKLYFDALKIYSELPRYRGAGHIIEQWVREANIAELHETAENNFKELLEGAKQ